MFNFKNKTLTYLCLNVIFSILVLLCSLVKYTAIVYILVAIYLAFVCLIDEIDIVINQIAITISTNVIYEMLWRKSTIQVPLELKYIVDVMSLLILIKLILKYRKYNNVLKDSIIILFIMFIVVSAAISFSKSNTLINYLMSLRIYIRFLPTYIVIAYNKPFFNKKDLVMLIILNVLLFFIQARISFMDDVSGVFGISNVQTLLLFLIILVTVVTTLYSIKKMKITSFIIAVILIFASCGISEIKLGIFIIPSAIIITIIFNSNKFSKIIIGIVISIIMINFGINIITEVSPKFRNFFNKDILLNNIVEYTMKTNNSEFTLGRVENIVYTHKYILIDNYSRTWGLGVGGAMPPDDYYFKSSKHSKGRKRWEIYSTPLYIEYGPSFGYHFSSMNLIYLENGFFGMAIFYAIMIIGIGRSIMLKKKSDFISCKCIASLGAIYVVCFIGLMFYYNYILNRSAIIVTVLVFAMVKNKLNFLEENSKNE